MSLFFSFSLAHLSLVPHGFGSRTRKSSINKISRQLNERRNDVGASGRDGGAWRWREKTIVQRRDLNARAREKEGATGRRAREWDGTTGWGGKRTADGFAGSVAWAIHACALAPSKLGACSLRRCRRRESVVHDRSRGTYIGEERGSRVKESREKKTKSTRRRTRRVADARAHTYTYYFGSASALLRLLSTCLSLVRSRVLPDSEYRRTDLPLVLGNDLNSSYVVRTCTQQDSTVRAARNMKTLMENQLSWLALFMTALYSCEYRTLSSPYPPWRATTGARPAYSFYYVVALLLEDYRSRFSCVSRIYFLWSGAISPEALTHFPLRLQEMQLSRADLRHEILEDLFNWSRSATSELNLVISWKYRAFILLYVMLLDVCFEIF